jgi:oxygen-dependent protoporphyrinogen oxidase
VKKDEDAIAHIVESEMSKLLGIDGPPVERLVWKHANALPQYNVGHEQTVAAVRQSISALQGVHLAGNYFQGRSLGDCVEIGSRTAEEVKFQMAGAVGEPRLERALN